MSVKLTNNNNNQKATLKNKRFHTFRLNDSLGFKDATRLIQGLKDKEFDVNLLTQDVLSRAERAQELNAIAAINKHVKPETINEKNATSGDTVSPFYGIPTFIKDNIDLRGIPTNHGSNAFSAGQARRNSPYTQQLLSTGLNVLGKSTLPEFGLNASTEPLHQDATRNPWNVDHSCGASSGGAAALVAAGVVPFAHGNDGGGSIRIPAACCGLVGLKPSRNRHINEYAARSLPINLVSEGILSRSVRDTALYHFELEKHYNNKKLPRLPLVQGPVKKRYKIGYFVDSVTGYSTDTETRDTIEKTANLLSNLGHTVEAIKFPVSAQFAEDFKLYWGFLAYMISKSGRYAFSKTFDIEKLDPLTRGLAKHFKSNMYKSPLVLKRLLSHAHQYTLGFAHYDMYLSPVLSQTPRPLGELSPTLGFDTLIERLERYAAFTPMANIAGTPAISVPMGMSKNGLPIGAQLAANLGQEQKLLELAFEVEDAMPWRHLYEMED